MPQARLKPQPIGAGGSGWLLMAGQLCWLAGAWRVTAAEAAQRSSRAAGQAVSRCAALHSCCVCDVWSGFDLKLLVQLDIRD